MKILITKIKILSVKPYLHDLAEVTTLPLWPLQLNGMTFLFLLFVFCSRFQPIDDERKTVHNISILEWCLSFFFKCFEYLTRLFSFLFQMKSSSNCDCCKKTSLKMMKRIDDLELKCTKLFNDFQKLSKREEKSKIDKSNIDSPASCTFHSGTISLSPHPLPKIPTPPPLIQSLSAFHSVRYFKIFCRNYTFCLFYHNNNNYFNGNIIIYSVNC